MTAVHDAFRAAHARVIPLTWMLSEDAIDAGALRKIHNKCVPIGDCLIWKGGVSTQGVYGYLGRGRYAHREAFLAYYGELPQGSLGHESASIEIHHKCHNKLCTNPLHLEAVSRADHSRRHKGQLRRKKLVIQ